MRYLIITAAGASERFNKGEAKERLKCIYYENKKWQTLLYRMIRLSQEMDQVVIVGGFLFDELDCYVRQITKKLAIKVQMIENLHYQEYGSGYSLKLGLEACMRDEECQEVIFAEGDLFFDSKGYRELLASKQSCLSFHNSPIRAVDSVAVYLDAKGQVKYIYDTEHHLFHIKEPFTAVFNSAQIWKFQSRFLLKETLSEMKEEQWRGTNLTFVEKYFGKLQGNYTTVGFRTWINCNTREDYRSCNWEEEN